MNKEFLNELEKKLEQERETEVKAITEEHGKADRYLRR